MENEQPFNTRLAKVGDTCIYIETAHDLTTYQRAVVERVTKTTVHIRTTDAPYITHIFNRERGSYRGSSSYSRTSRRLVGDYGSDGVREGYSALNESRSAANKALRTYITALRAVRDNTGNANMSLARMDVDGTEHTRLAKLMQECSNAREAASTEKRVFAVAKAVLAGRLAAARTRQEKARIHEHVTTRKPE